MPTHWNSHRVRKHMRLLSWADACSRCPLYLEPTACIERSQSIIAAARRFGQGMRMSFTMFYLSWEGTIPLYGYGDERFTRDASRTSTACCRVSSAATV